MPIKAVVFGLGDTLIVEGSEDFDPAITQALLDLFDFLRLKGIEPIILSNRDWVIKGTSGKKPIDDYLKKRLGNHHLIVTSREALPPKPKIECVNYLLNKFSLKSNEVIYVGSNEMDFRTAVNGNILFLNAVWKTKSVDYGFQFDHPQEITQFISNFCLKQHPWQFMISNPIRFYSLAPFSTYREEYEAYSRAARVAAKANTPLKKFFLQHLTSSIYLSDLHEEFDYIAVYPGHKAGSGSKVMDDTLDTVGKSFRKRYIPDLIIRHKDAVKAQAARIAGTTLDFVLNQLNTIHLNPMPHKGPGKTYSNFRSTIEGKVILVVDDFCTDGCSLEAARKYIEKAGGQAVLLSWLKTINTDYNVVRLRKDFDPFRQAEFNKPDYSIESVISYHKQVVDPGASKELNEKYNAFLREYLS